jgi:hypothetical protein
VPHALVIGLLRQKVPDGLVVDLPLFLKQGRVGIVTVPVAGVSIRGVLDQADPGVVLVQPVDAAAVLGQLGVHVSPKDGSAVVLVLFDFSV